MTAIFRNIFYFIHLFLLAPNKVDHCHTILGCISVPILRSKKFIALFTDDDNETIVSVMLDEEESMLYFVDVDPAKVNCFSVAHRCIFTLPLLRNIRFYCALSNQLMGQLYMYAEI